MTAQPTSSGKLPARPYTVLYDGDCSVCSRIAGIFSDWDRNGDLHILPSQTPGIRERFPWITERQYEVSLQVVAADGRTFQGARGIEEVLNVLPKGRWLAWIFRIPLIRPLAERFYRWFARNRHNLGCGDHCSIRRESPGQRDSESVSISTSKSADP